MNWIKKELYLRPEELRILRGVVLTNNLLTQERTERFNLREFNQNRISMPLERAKALRHIVRRAIGYTSDEAKRNQLLIIACKILYD